MVAQPLNTAQAERVCVVCGEPLTGKQTLYCRKGHKTTARRRILDVEAAPIKNAMKPPKSEAPAKTPKPARKPRIAPAKSQWTRQETPPKPTPNIRYGEVFEGTMLMSRKQGGNKVAPVYVGVDTLSVCDRLLLAFKDADRLKIYAVEVDGVLYPKLDGEWYVWKRPRLVYEFTLRQMGLPQPEIDFRLSLQRFEDAKHNLMMAFPHEYPAPEFWTETLKFQRQMLDKARQINDTHVMPQLVRKVNALCDAIAARDYYEQCWQSAQL